jgi:hypothetical protein
MSNKTIALYFTKSGKEAARVTAYTTPRGSVQLEARAIKCGGFWLSATWKPGA